MDEVRAIRVACRTCPLDRLGTDAYNFAVEFEESCMGDSYGDGVASGEDSGRSVCFSERQPTGDWHSYSERRDYAA